MAADVTGVFVACEHWCLQFDKQYSYGVRYNFGKEGKRIDYTPYSCIKIITSNPPATGDYHGM